MMKNIAIVFSLFFVFCNAQIQYHPSRLLVTLNTESVSGLNTNNINFKRYGVNVLKKYDNLNGNILTVQVSDGTSLERKKRQLERLSEFSLVEYDYVVKSSYKDGNSSVDLYGLDKIKAPCAWNRFGYGSCSTKVCVIDTGVDYNHDDLNANAWLNSLEFGKTTNIDDDSNGYRDDIRGINAITMTGDPMDDNRHGTHCAGTIAATINRKGAIGVAPNTKIIGCKFLSGSGSGFTSDAIKCINYCKGIFDRDARENPFAQKTGIYSNSWGGGGFSATLYNAIRQADTGLTRGLFVFAAGNDGVNNDVSFTYPASYNLSNIVSVAASDSLDRLASFSSYGRTTVDIAAPGVSIYSTLPNRSYGYLSGTSMATPHVAGVAALLVSRKPSAQTEELKNALLRGVDVVPAFVPRMVSGGRLNAVKSLNVLLNTNVVC